ncbi:MAG: hypothetical protein A3F68_09300 [Acidobacteria bacterium RIFCSPLOWO2_12_FULL_54_10]|nr:MAG: hypothetical protein A3F68_09300 [Acidobacteria bacterium RIFCSPLOWO2_12_FULL_54_10]
MNRQDTKGVLMIRTGQNFETVEGGCAGLTRVTVPVHGERLLAGWGLMGLSPTSAGVALLLGILGLGMTACGPRHLNVMYTPEQTLITIGYAADRSRSIFRADNEAQEYCERRDKTVVFLKQETVYQGQYDEDVTAATRAAGRVAGALGSSEAAEASKALSSPTDYKTTFEFLCQ